MPRGHKYIKKYRNSHGNWTYVYPGDRSKSDSDPNSKDLRPWAYSEINPHYRTPNGLTPKQNENLGNNKGPKISSNSTNDHDPFHYYRREVQNTNKLLSSSSRRSYYLPWYQLRAGTKENPVIRKYKVTVDTHNVGRLERTYKRGKRKADKIIRSAKRAGSKAINRGKQAVRNFLPHTEIHVHDAELH